MAITDELLFSPTPASNTTLGASITLDGAVMTPSQVDDAFREQMSYRAKAITRHVTKTAGSYTPAKADYNQFWRCTGAVTLNLTAAATLTDGWCLWVRANGGAVTIDPNGAETIDGAATLVLADGQTTFIICNGTTFYTVMQGTAGGSVDPGHIFGLVLTNDAGDATNDIAIAVGSAASDDTEPAKMVLSAALGKRLDANWAVGGVPGTALGGLDTGSVGNNVYYVWLIRRPDTGVVDALFSLSSTAPTMPANYTQKRVIGSFIRVSAANNAPRSYSEKETTPWVAYTPTFTGFGTAASIFVESRRAGDTLQLRGKFTSGTVSATEARMSLGYNGVNNIVTSDATKVPTIQFAGSIIRSAAGAPQAVLLAESAVGYLTFGLQGAADGGLNKVLGTALVSSIVYGFAADVPIGGW